VSDRTAWPWYLGLLVAGMALVFAGIAARESLPGLANVIVPVGGIAAVIGPVLWWRALLRKHGPGPMLLALVVILAVLALAGTVIQRFARP
jgi:drug/metabolite transporter (DMT)-like permease